MHLKSHNCIPYPNQTHEIPPKSTKLFTSLRQLTQRIFAPPSCHSQDLVAGYRIRCNNHSELMETLKQVRQDRRARGFNILPLDGANKCGGFDSGAFQVNQIIQKAARLRLGKSKNVVISECRNSIKANNINQLIKVITVVEIKTEETEVLLLI